ncbi:hypothetical protein LCGC14_1367890 [marine sediment metagenome]|uniref:Uncharacterized protein n=1 Tax=marine sediment metagenome TaxID=412755 RepID=A0A0F9K6K9_9ZZZZ
MKKVHCIRCEKEFEASEDNKLVGLVGTKDTWMCNKCLAIEAEHKDFADDRGVVSDALRIAE